MSVPTPIKRSKELAPLSREHHEGLLFVFKIRQGMKGNISLDRMVAFCTWNWNHHFEQHFRKEETELAPLLGSQHPLITRMLQEHILIRDQIKRVQEYPSGTALEELVQLINDHIRFEERQLFALIEQSLTPDQSKALEEALAETNLAAEPWTDEFWVRPK